MRHGRTHADYPGAAAKFHRPGGERSQERRGSNVRSPGRCRNSTCPRHIQSVQSGKALCTMSRELKIIKWYEEARTCVGGSHRVREGRGSSMADGRQGPSHRNAARTMRHSLAGSHTHSSLRSYHELRVRADRDRGASLPESEQRRSERERCLRKRCWGADKVRQEVIYVRGTSITFSVIKIT